MDEKDSIISSSTTSTTSSAIIDPMAGLNGIKNYTFKNWAGIFSCKPQLFFQPSNIDEVTKIILNAYKEGKTFTVIGSGHSPSDLCCANPNGWLVNLDKLNRVLDFKVYDGGNYADITVEAGLRVYKLNEILGAKGYTIQNLGSISEQSVAGITATGTHGSSAFHGLVSSQYVNLTIINGKGELIYLDSETNQDVFRAALLSLGKIGVIVKATIRAIPKYKIKSTQEVIHFETLLEKWDDIWTSSEFIRCWWYPYTRKCVLWRGNKTTEQVHEITRKSWWGTKFGRIFYECLLWISVKIYPGITPFVETFVFNRQYGAVETFGNGDVAIQESIDGLNMDCLFSQFVDEWGCPLLNGPEVLRSLDHSIQQAASNKEFYVHVPIEVRCSNTTLPPHQLDYSHRTSTSKGAVYGNILRPYLDATPRDLQYAEHVTNNQLTLYINATIYRPFGANTPIHKWFTLFEHTMGAAGGKPHWAKNFLGDVSMLPKGVKPKEKYLDYEMRGMASEIIKWYGEDLIKWQQIRKQQDPNGVFLANKDWCIRNGILEV
ncbi:probable D-arabinono-1,4-lactone oxidase [Saccharomycodes ludwigii]|uniref:D-arabinono-1,4-lactone oxidase n=1 Tax=Saccharomycodes ludwigii TaxID=36035 RepID=A0A376BCK6_9ASCO|nr:probable D-arabinono-1,4-lactone oxidase [Saccharomycodes ludwigii]